MYYWQVYISTYTVVQEVVKRGEVCRFEIISNKDYGTAISLLVFSIPYHLGVAKKEEGEVGELEVIFLLVQN